jgi:site-specific DNA-adenine methylase
MEKDRVFRIKKEDKKELMKLIKQSVPKYYSNVSESFCGSGSVKGKVKR